MYYCTMPVPDWGGGGGGGGLGALAPTPHEEAAVSVLKKFWRIYMYGNGLMVFGWFGVFRGRNFPKKKFSASYVR